jgi:hypothetical protein
VLLHADRADDLELREEPPVPTPKPGEALRFRAGRSGVVRQLERCLAARMLLETSVL